MRLLKEWIKNKNEPLKVEVGSKVISLDNISIKSQFETAGKKSFKFITRAYYKGSIAAIIAFDIFY